MIIMRHRAVAWVLAIPLIAASAWSDESATQKGESQVGAQDIQRWVDDLSHDRYLRREAARTNLINAGTQAVAGLVKSLDFGDLETTHSAIHILQGIALRQSPDDEGSAWGALQRLADTGAGSRMTRSAAAVEEIREYRSEQAIRALRSAGVSIGPEVFVLGAITQPERKIIRIDEDWNGDMESLRWLRWIRGIEYATVKGPAVSRDVLRYLSTTPDLTTIVLIDGDVTVETIQALESMGRIDSLEFRYVKLDEKMADSIMALPLRISLTLMGTEMPKQVVDKMREQLPGLHIDYKKGAFLGVVFTTSFNDVAIGKVVQDSAAEKAGLNVGDVILSIDDKKVDQFTDLREAIGQHIAGDQVRVKYRRGAKVFTVDVKLGKFKNL